MLRWIAPVLVLGLAGTSFAAPAVPKDFPAPDLETGTPLDTALPAIPAFELPPGEPGFEDPKRLRVKGKKLLDTKVKVKGYITWIYNCVEAVRMPKESAARTQKRIDEDPTICERPKFYLGAEKTTPPERSVWVVDVPRPPNKLEKERLPKDEIKNWPKVPKYKVGDFVIVSGDFKISSPHNEHNSDGLLVFESIEAAKPRKADAVATTAAPAPTARPKPTLSAVPLAAIELKQRGISMVALRNGNIAHAKRQYPDAIKIYREAVAAWPQNHLAWYGLGGSLAGQGDWTGAFEAFEKAVAIHPEAPMYQMWSGVSAYEKVVSTARADEARKQGRKPDEVQVDLTTLNFEPARARLEIAAALAPNMWRARYYLGRVYRNAEQMRSAAEEFTEAARSKPAEQGPWIALGELYRKWDYSQQALDVMKVAVLQIIGAQASDLWFVYGMAHDDRDDFQAAIQAFTTALDVKPDNVKAQFQRGQAYYKLGKWAEAKADLEAFVKAPSSLEFAKQQANKMLMDLETKKPAKKK